MKQKFQKPKTNNKDLVNVAKELHVPFIGLDRVNIEPLWRIVENVKKTKKDRGFISIRG